MGNMYDLLTSAATRGDVLMARDLLRMGLDPNGMDSSGHRAIQVADLKCPKMTELLLAHGANPNIQHSRTGATPAHRAARNGSLETLTALLHGGANIHLSDRGGHLPMDLASKNMVNDLQSRGILSAKRHHIMQDTMGRFVTVD